MFAQSVLALAALLCLLVWLSRPRDEQIVVLSHRHAMSPAKIAHHAASTPTTPATPTTASLPPPNLETAIDVAVTAAGADALRRVAHARAVDLGRGPELLTTFTDLSVGGGALALNALANVHALGYRHHLIGGYAAHVCAELGAAVRRGRPVGWESMLRTPCVRDSWWEAHVGAARRRVALSARSGVWFIRWSIVARLVRLGYNVLNVDADVALLDDVVRHLHSDLICGRFALSFASDYDVGQNWLQNGVVYACGAARDGAAAWVLAEEVDRYLRLCDACGGWQDGDSDGAATRPCPKGSWLHGARGYSAFSFDQWHHRSAVHIAATGEGVHWQSVLEDMVAHAAPFSAGGAQLRRAVDAGYAALPHGRMKVHSGPAPVLGRGRGAALRGWVRSELRDGNRSDDDASHGWARRFSFGTASSRAFWTRIRPATPLAKQLPDAVGAALDGAWQAAARKPPPPLAPNERGLLPHERGRLSRAWQATLDADLDSLGGSNRRVGVGRGVSDAPGGARWAAAPHGDEALLLLPHFVACHWTVGHRGLVGTTPPRTLLFHATNAADKELALKANGYWHYAAANLLRANASIEGQIWGGGARPNVVVHAGEAAAAALATATYDEHLDEVVLPLLLAAILSGRLPVLPALPCAETRWLRRPLPDPPQPPDADDFVAGSCRASPACAIRHVAAGATGAKERARDDARAAAFGYRSPFGGGADAERIGRAPLHCVPFEGDQPARDGNPLDNPGCASGHGEAFLLRSPEWAAYRRLLEEEAGELSVHAVAAPRGGAMTYAAFAEAVRAAPPTARLLHLPARLRLTAVPAEARKAFDNYCELHKWPRRRPPPTARPPAGAGAARLAAAVEAAARGARPGHCGETITGDEGSCTSGDRGSWTVEEAPFAGAITDATSCLHHCATRCGRCRFVSFSAAQSDCSWYHDCNLERLGSAAFGHTTLAVTAEVRTAAAAAARRPPPVVEPALWAEGFPLRTVGGTTFSL